jgi:hypothetical protein
MRSYGDESCIEAPASGMVPAWLSEMGGRGGRDAPSSQETLSVRERREEWGTRIGIGVAMPQVCLVLGGYCE